MPAIRAASVSTRNGRIATVIEYHDNDDEYSYVFEDGIIQEATFHPADRRIICHMDYIRQKREDTIRLVELQTIETKTSERLNKESLTPRFEDHETFNRKVKGIFEEYVGRQMQEVE